MPVTLRIEHPIPDFATWKAAFDSDPVDRAASGVRRYRIFRPLDDPNYILVDLEFDTTDEAEALLAGLRGLWSGAGARVSANQKARIVDAVEAVEYPFAGTGTRP